MTPALREIADRLRKLSYTEMKALGAQVFDSLPATGMFNADRVIEALLAATEEWTKPLPEEPKAASHLGARR